MANYDDSVLHSDRDYLVRLFDTSNVLQCCPSHSNAPSNVDYQSQVTVNVLTTRWSGMSPDATHRAFTGCPANVDSLRAVDREQWRVAGGTFDIKMYHNNPWKLFIYMCGGLGKPVILTKNNLHYLHVLYCLLY